MSANWTTVENALRAWVKAGSSLDDGHVYWDDQTGPRPSDSATAPFITLHLGDVLPVGGLDELADITDADLNQNPGAEIELRVVGTRQFHLTVQAFTPNIVNGSTARALLSKVQTALRLESVRDALATAGVTPFDVGQVLNITALVGTKFEGRAALTVGFYALETVSERTTYIETCVPQNFMGPPASGTKEDIDI